MLIADAALQVIGEQGIRGLTHLAVDARAELPKGSTSYYCRKRVDLLRLALTRLYVLDRADLDALAERLEAARPAQDEIPRRVAELIVGWLTEPHRTRTIARFELYLACSHEPELHELLGEQFGAIGGLAGRVAEATTPVGRPEQVAASLMLAEGLMLTVVRQGLPTPSHEDVARLLSTVALPATAPADA
ncbi:MAG: hypothetical protein AAGC46_08865 [Solirubrobacteraceae bacterium]|nr:hypothetical protein [Patulibacter sp.]